MTRVVGGALVALLVVGLAVWWWTGRGADAAQQRVGRAVSSFVVPNSWVLERRDSEPPRRICLSGGCPSERVDYKVPGLLTRTRLQEVITGSGWPLTVTGSCVVPDNVSGVVPVCSAEGDVGGAEVSVSQIASSQNSSYVRIVLEVVARN